MADKDAPIYAPRAVPFSLTASVAPEPAPAANPGGTGGNGGGDADSVVAAAAVATPELVIPADLSALTPEELNNLSTQATNAFDALFGEDGSNLNSEEFASLRTLTEAVETLTAEQIRRVTEQEDRNASVAELLARARPAPPAEASDSTPETPAVAVTPEVVAPVVAGEAPPASESPASLAASSRPELRIDLRGIRASQPSSTTLPPQAPATAPGIRDYLLSAGMPNMFDAGQGIDWYQAGQVVDQMLTGFNRSQYASAASAGKHVHDQRGVAIVRKPFAENMRITSDDYAHVDEVLTRAVNEHLLPGGSLVASGGWCSPSTTIYELFGIESRDGLFDLPEVGVTRGGIKWPKGPNFADVFGQGFHYTEAEMIAGDFDGSGGGSKPVHKIPCPEFVEKRLEAIGLAIEAGLFQQHGYPELIARTLSLAMTGHVHRVSGRIIADLVAGSTAVTMAGDTVGVIAPLLTSIELQVEHTRYINRMSRGSSLEGVFPFWVRGAIRSDMALRNGVAVLSVTNAQVDSWFRERGVAPQYVYNWQDLTGAPNTFLAWPSTVKFLLYPAGTWAKGGSEIISINALFDSLLLGTNEYTALFTEESYLTAKLGHDSRVVTASIDASGTTGAGVLLGPDGVPLPEPVYAPESE